MNTNILKKCLEELNKETPRIDYVKGMLESVIELSANTYSVKLSDNVLPNKVTIESPKTVEPVDEEGSGLLSSYEKGRIGGLQS